MRKQKVELFEPTQMQSFTFCPWKYYLTYIKKEIPSYMAQALVRGRIGHDVISHGVEHYDDVFDAAMAYYKSGDCPETKHPLHIELKDELVMRDDLRQMIVNGLAATKLRGIEILEMERYEEFTIKPGKREYFFKGTMDVIAKFPDTPDGYVEILDWKFGRKQGESQMGRNLQHGLYYYALRQKGIKVHRNWWVDMGDFLPFKRNGKTAVKGELRGPGFYPIVIQDSDLPFIIQQCGRICAIIQQGWFFQSAYGPNSPCSYCEFADSKLCPSFEVGSKHEGMI